MSQAHLPLSCAGILCLSSADILPRRASHLQDSTNELYQAGCRACTRFWSRIRPFRLPWADGSNVEQAVSLFKRSLPRLLGAEHLGNVLIHRSSPHLRYVRERSVGNPAEYPLAAPYLKLPVDFEAVNSVTRGLVGDTSFAVLPNISPRVTFIATLAAQIVSQQNRTSESIPDRIAATSHQALLLSDLGQFHRLYHSLRFCVFPVRLACSREGNSTGHHTVQPVGVERPTAPRSFQASCSRWTRLVVPSALHCPGVPDQDRLYHPLAHPVSSGFRSAGASVSEISLSH